MKDYDEVFRAVLNTFREPLFILSGKRECIFANQAFFTFFGVQGGDRGQISINDFWPEVGAANLSCSELLCDLRLARGETFSVKLEIHPLSQQHNLVRVLSGLSKNEGLANFHTQRLETLGMLAGGVAHDFNNILAGILGHVTYLKTILPAKGTHVESLKAVEEGAKKATTVTQQILNFSKLESVEETKEIDVCDLAIRTCALLRGAVSPEYQLIYNLPSKPVCIYAVEGKLAQVLVNLIINARDALAPGGQIEVSVSVCDKPELLKEVFGTIDLPCAHYVALAVSDNGHGISSAVMERMFEPYFSTKKGKGTGLGLSTVAAIVRLFGGAIKVTSEINIGTEVTVYLPLMQRDNSETRSHSIGGEETQLERGTEKILVVDDEYPVRNVLSVSLEHLGYDVEVAASGAEAIERFSDAGGVFDLVILDMLMPQLSGEKVFYRLKDLNPHVRVLLISGYSSEESIRNVLSSGGLGFIQKPFTIEELSKQVRKCLIANSK